MAKKIAAVAQVPAAQAVAVQKAADIALSNLIGHARKSGCALKVSTVNNKLAYPVNFELKNGASAVMSAAYLLAAGLKTAESVESAKVLDVLDAVTIPGSKEGKVLDALLAQYQKSNPSKKPFGNLANLRTLIRKEIKSGNILRFAPEAGANVGAVLALALKVK